MRPTRARSYHLLATIAVVNASAHLMAPTTTYHARTLSRANERSRSVAHRSGTVCQNQSAPPLIDDQRVSSLYVERYVLTEIIVK